jgi:hypothetical protein
MYNDTPGHLGDAEETLAQERQIMEILRSRLEKLEFYDEKNSELLSYNLAEIMVLAKRLYTEILPEIARCSGEDPEQIWGVMSGLRMHLLHTRDCIDGFESNLLNLMEDERKSELLESS